MGCNPKSHLEVDKWQDREDNSLDPCLTNQWEGGEQIERGEREEEESFRERSVSLVSRFSSNRFVKSQRGKRQS